jgi:hypothetical protein
MIIHTVFYYIFEFFFVKICARFPPHLFRIFFSLSFRQARFCKVFFLCGGKYFSRLQVCNLAKKISSKFFYVWWAKRHCAILYRLQGTVCRKWSGLENTAIIFHHKNIFVTLHGICFTTGWCPDVLHGSERCELRLLGLCCRSAFKLNLKT